MLVCKYASHATLFTSGIWNYLPNKHDNTRSRQKYRRCFLALVWECSKYFYNMEQINMFKQISNSTNRIYLVYIRSLIEQELSQFIQPTKQNLL